MGAKEWQSLSRRGATLIERRYNRLKTVN